MNMSTSIANLPCFPLLLLLPSCFYPRLRVAHISLDILSVLLDRCFKRVTVHVVNRDGMCFIQARIGDFTIVLNVIGPGTKANIDVKVKCVKIFKRCRHPSCSFLYSTVNTFCTLHSSSKYPPSQPAAKYSSEYRSHISHTSSTEYE